MRTVPDIRPASRRTVGRPAGRAAVGGAGRTPARPRTVSRPSRAPEPISSRTGSASAAKAWRSLTAGPSSWTRPAVGAGRSDHQWSWCSQRSSCSWRLILVGSLAVWVVVSPPPVTVTVFVTWACALQETSTFRVMGG